MPRAPFHLDAIKRALADGELRQTDLAKATGLKVGTLWAAVQPGIRTGQLLVRKESTAVFYRLAGGVEIPPPAPGACDVHELVALCCTEGPKIIEALEDVGEFIDALRSELNCADDTEQILGAVRGLKSQLAAVRGAIGAAA